jgi:hypothetical protein
MNWQKLQILLKLINHCPSTSMYAEMIESKREIRDIRLDFGIEQLLCNQSSKEEKLLT